MELVASDLLLTHMGIWSPSSIGHSPMNKKVPRLELRAHEGMDWGRAPILYAGEATEAEGSPSSYYCWWVPMARGARYPGAQSPVWVEEELPLAVQPRSEHPVSGGLGGGGGEAAALLRHGCSGCELAESSLQGGLQCLLR